MKPKKVAAFRLPTSDEQQVLLHLRVRPVRADEVLRFDELVTEHHYLKSAQLVGEHLRYVAVYQEQWLALAACLCSADRPGTNGRVETQCRGFLSEA